MTDYKHYTIRRETFENYSSELEKLGCDVSTVGYVTVEPWVFSLRDDCHNNCMRFVRAYGGEAVNGFYLIENSDRIFVVSHSVVDIEMGLLDITPFVDERARNVFVRYTEPVNYLSYIIERDSKNVITIRNNDDLSRYMEFLQLVDRNPLPFPDSDS